MPIPRSTRFEIKMVADGFMLLNARSWILAHPAGFYEAYPMRQVNNVYFDTSHLNSFAENLAGGAARRKVRLRWYGEDTKNIRGIFEVKCKRNMLGWKITQRLTKTHNLSTTKWIKVIDSIRDELEDDLRIILDFTGSPILINRYKREYYTSLDKEVRATIDYSQMVYDQRFSSFPNLRFPSPPPNNVIMEFKSNSKNHERLSDVLAEIPLRVSKYSKYSESVSSLLGYR